jgi:hypothetical protein
MKISREAKEILDGMRKDGFDDQQIMDAMKDGDFLEKSGISQGDSEDIYYFLKGG